MVYLMGVKILCLRATSRVQNQERKHQLISFYKFILHKRCCLVCKQKYETNFPCVHK